MSIRTVAAVTRMKFRQFIVAENFFSFFFKNAYLMKADAAMNILSKGWQLHKINGMYSDLFFMRYELQLNTVIKDDVRLGCVNMQKYV